MVGPQRPVICAGPTGILRVHDNCHAACPRPDSPPCPPDMCGLADTLALLRAHETGTLRDYFLGPDVLQLGAAGS